MGPTAGSGGLGLIVGVLEGAMGDLVGLRAFPGAAHDDVVRGGWVNRSSPTDRTGELINYSVFSGSRADGPLDRALDGRDSHTRSG